MKKPFFAALAVVSLTVPLLLTGCDVLDDLIPGDTYVESIVCYPDTDTDSSILIDPEKRPVTLRDGRLGDVAPTVLQLLGLPVPEEMTGESLIASGDVRADKVMLVILALKYCYMPEKKKKTVARFSEPQSIIPDDCFNGLPCLT